MTGRDLMFAIHEDLKKMGISDQHVGIAVSGDFGDLSIATIESGARTDG
jgi:hypothetical protein